MSKKQISTDGFIRRRTPSQDGNRRLGVDEIKAPHRLLNNDPKQIKQETDSVHNSGSVRKSDIDASLRAIDDENPQKKKRKLPRKKLIKRIVIAVVILLIIVGLYFGIKALIAGSRVVGGNLFDLFSQGKPLKTDEFGRSNIVLFGTSEDSSAHLASGEGPNLSDSIMLLSIDQEEKTAALTSVPRDLWVKYDQACISGFEGKINVVYQCGSNDGESEAEGSKALMSKVGEVYGLEMHYYIQVNYRALRQAVDSVGGITVDIESDDPRGVLDRNFDWQCNFECFYVKYPNGPAKLDGERALFLARARNSAGGYGLSGGNFDREANQQKILLALQQKAVSAGTLTNPVAINGLIDTLGENVRTNFEAAEIKTLIDLAGKIEESSIKRLSLEGDPEKEIEPLITTGNVSGQSIVRPVKGLYDFSDIQSFIRRQLSNDPMVKESASIDVLNGSSVAGVAQTKADELTKRGFSVGTIGNAPTDGDYGKVSVYAIGKAATEKPATAKKLEEVVGVKVSSGSLPGGVTSTAHFVVIVGETAE